MMKQSSRCHVEARWALVIAIVGWALVLLLVVPLGLDRHQWNLFASGVWAASAESGRERATERWQDVLGKAKKEGKVVLLGPPVAEVRPSIIQAFQKEFPEIALDYQPGSLGPMTAKLRAELASKKTSFDVAIGGTSVLRSRDLFDPINTRLMHPDANRPEAWRSTRGKGLKWVDHEKQLALQTSEWVFAYVLVNSKLVEPASLTTWQDLLKPQWKEKIAFFDPRGSGAGEEVASYLLVKFGEKFILDLVKTQNVGLTRSYSQIADWLAQGKYAVGIAQVPDRIEALRKEGVPLRAYSLTDAPGTLTGGFSVVSMFKNSPNPNAATVFINWILTKAGQEALMRPQLYPSLRSDVATDFVPQYTLPQPGLDYLDTYTEEFQSKREQLSKQVRELLGR